MDNAWGRARNYFQTKITPTILHMLAKYLSLEALLLVCLTGSGKSAHPKTTLVVANGVSIIIELALIIISDK